MMWSVTRLTLDVSSTVAMIWRTDAIKASGMSEDDVLQMICWLLMAKAHPSEYG